MKRFGTLLRVYRRQCRDPLRGGMLTQERLGEMLGAALGHAGYSGAAVSDWERNKSKIDEDDRAVLLALLSVLVACHGLRSVREANELLHAGNYRALDADEHHMLFPDELAQSTVPDDAVGEQPVEIDVETGVLSDERRRQLILLQKVQRFWIQGVLQTMLSGSLPLQLVWQRAPGMVQQPWEAVIHPDLVGQRGGQAVIEAYDNADRALLILGDAGSGKTTTLLRLAQALATRATSVVTEPIPVVLNLSSWAADRLPLVDWVTEELVAKYQIPRRIGRPWLEDDALVLLLDGFDELSALQRPACARAINAFRREWGLTGLVVTTRPAEYESTGLRLKLGGAIRLLPLTETQRDAYLRLSGARLAGLRRAMAGDDTLRQLGRSPLFLEIMSVVFGDAAPADVSGLADGDSQTHVHMVNVRRRLFSAYEQRIFRMHGWQAPFSREETRRLLAWLAAKMEAHDQTVFLLEELQPSWLSPRDRRLYLLLSHLISGFLGGLVLWFILQWARAIIPRFPVVVAPALMGWTGIDQGTAEPLVLVAGSLSLSLLTFIVHFWQFERRPFSPQSANEWLLRRRGLFVGLMTGGLTIIVVLFFGELALALSWGLALGFMYATLSRYLTGIDYRHDIHPVEAIGWSWPQAAKGLLVALALAAAAEILETALFGYNGIMRSVISFGFAGFLVGGLRGRRIEKKSALNQGILLSLRSAAASTFLVALLLGVLTWLMRTPRAASMTAVLSLLIVFPFFGGATVLKHYLVRLFLWCRGHMPLRYGRLLEHAAQLGLLRRVGGGYTFIHRLLQEHFARMHRGALS